MLPIIGQCYITQGYGKTKFAQTPMGMEYYKNFGGIHPGIDFGTRAINLPVTPLIQGKVVFAGTNKGWGNSIEIMGEDGWRRQYAHLEDVLVKVGYLVKSGDVIGHVGKSGAGTGVHLHYGNRRWNMLKMRWEYRDPSGDFEDKPEEPVMPTSRLIKSNHPDERAVYFWDGSTKYPIIDEPMAFALFNGDKYKDEIELVEHDVLVKLPEGSWEPNPRIQYKK